MSDPLLHVRLEAGYGKQVVLSGVDFTVDRGERFGLVGSSGAGKSTLVLALLGLLPWRQGWAKGEVRLAGQDLLALKASAARSLLGRVIALVPQSPMNALNAAISLRAHFEQAWLAHRPHLNREFKTRVGDLMEQVRLPAEANFLDRRPGAVSVGQAQRATLALALLHRPSLIVADEPTSALDPCTQQEILDLLLDLNGREQVALLYISHDLLSVIQFCQRIAVLDGGRIVESVAIEALALGGHHPVTEALLRTLPVPVTSLLEHGHRRRAGEVTSRG